MKRRSRKIQKPTTQKKSVALVPRRSIEPVDVSGLYEEVRTILDEARHRAARSVNVEMVRAYWLIGQAIVEHEQQGKGRADYGERLIKSLSERLTDEVGRGFSKNNLWYMRQFYLTYPEKLHALRGELSWTHYRLLLKVESAEARAFYEQEAATVKR
jgi:hypothetical protein